jgi:hypothetical protein
MRRVAVSPRRPLCSDSVPYWFELGLFCLFGKQTIRIFKGNCVQRQKGGFEREHVSRTFISLRRTGESETPHVSCHSGKKHRLFDHFHAYQGRICLALWVVISEFIAKQKNPRRYCAIVFVTKVGLGVREVINECTIVVQSYC